MSSASAERWREVEPDEAERHKHTAAVAQRIALHEASILLDAHAACIAKQNRGRRKGTLSVDGQKLHDAVKGCADMVWAMLQSIEVPKKIGPVYVPSSVSDRSRLEAEVERQVPGTYPHRTTPLPREAGR